MPRVETFRRGATALSAEPARASVTGLAVRLGLALEREDAGNVVARLTVKDILRESAERDFRPISISRYAMYYRHEPGWVMCLLSRPVLLPLAKATIGIANQFAGRFGNKLTVQAVGKTEEAA